ncbi:MAG: hypothetical protein R3B84_01225 [Zavarzinella sp.]
MSNIPWWGYVVFAGLAWGTYVPIIFYGGSEFGGKPSSRMMAILCVGMAYFVMAVVFPMARFLSGADEWPPMKTTGLVFSCLAGIAGAIGAICVIFASKAAMAAGAEAQKLNPTFNPSSYRLLIAPMIFGLAPIINTILSSVWHPKPGNPWHFGLEMPNWKILAGIVMVAAGVFLVLYGKEQAEDAKKRASAPAPKPQIAATEPPSAPANG